MGGRWQAHPDLTMASALTMGALSLQLPLLAAYPGGWDAIDFALALERFDLAAMQPHFPGYPIFIWLGRLVHGWVDDPFIALALVSALAGAAAVGLFYLLAVRVLLCLIRPAPPAAWTHLPPAWRDALRRAQSVAAGWDEAQARFAALAAAAWLALSPLFWLTSVQPMSDSLGLACLLAALYAAWHWLAAPHPAPGRAALAGLLLGLTLGVRLSYFPFGLTLALVAAFRTFAGRRHWPEWPALAAGGLAGVAPWLLWLMAEEGAGRLLTLGLHFTAGHMTDWGNAVGGAVSAGERAARFWLFNWMGHGLGGPVPGGASWRAIPLAVAVAGLAGWLMRGKGSAAAWRFLAAWLLPYLLWAYLGQNPYNPRHILPLVPWAVLVAVGGWLRWSRAVLAAIPQLAPGAVALAGGGPGGPGLPQASEEQPAAGPGPAGRQAVALTGTLALVAALTATAWPLALEQHRTPPPAVQLAFYLRDRVPAAGTQVYTWEEERTIRYYAPDVRVTRLRKPEDFLAHLLSQPRPPERILATSYVLDGFGPAGAELRDFFRPVAHFAGHPAIQHTYTQITLYEAGPELYEYARRR